MKSYTTEKISVIALVLLITGSIDSIRNLPTTALFGSTLIFFFIFSAIVFLIPVALIAAELSSTWSEEAGGIYTWVHHAFSPNWAFLAVWLQWINTMVWYPTMLLFIAGILAYWVNPELAQQKTYLVTVTVGIFWTLTWLGLQGIRASARVAGFCAIVGMIIPMAVIIVFATIWVFSGKSIAIDMSWPNLIPHWTSSQSWVSLTAMMTSFLGMELAAVHVRNIDKAQHNFPKAMYFSVLLILFTMSFSSLAIAFVLPANHISLVRGVMQAFVIFFNAYHLQWIMPLLIVLLLLGSLGSMVNWIISPAKGLLLAADNGFLPQWLHRLNHRGIASRILILQACLVTILCGGFFLLPSVNGIYWLFTDLSTELYIMMYVLMFIAAIRLKSRFPAKPRAFTVPGGHFGYYVTCVLGLLGCMLALVVGFIPPEDAIQMGAATYRKIFGAGIIVMLIPALLLYCTRSRFAVF